MSTSSIQLPQDTRQQLESFQQLVRRIKIAEGILAGIFGLAVSYLIVFGLDRFVDTSAAIRLITLLSGCVGLGFFFPIKCHRWVWGTRRMEQVATLVKQRYPGLGDQLLGVVELARDNAEVGSVALAKAAVEHVDEVVRDKDLTDAVPRPHHRRWAIAAAVPILLGGIALAVVPDAAINAMQRWLMPWSDVDRYTFAQVEQLPESMVVAHGEKFSFSPKLSKETEWAPKSGTVLIEGQKPLVSERVSSREGQHYDFTVPPQTQSGTMNIRIGDVREEIAVRVESRPELAELTAIVQLPDYLQITEPRHADVRGGVVSIVTGSVASFDALINRELDSATINGSDTPVDSQQVEEDVTDEDGKVVSRIVHQFGHLQVPAMDIHEDQSFEIQWVDNLGLSGKDGFRLRVKAVEDSRANVSLQMNSTEQVVLASDVVSFNLNANDDFGLKEVGLKWRGVADPLANPSPDNGEKLGAAGGPDVPVVSQEITFSAESEGMRPQLVEVRAYAVDYMTNRERSYSQPILLHVMSPEEHAIWITEKLRRWASLADDVYEEEVRLHDANRELRRMAPGELNTAKIRRRIEQQSTAERANGQRLGAVTDVGEQLLQQAMRNEQMMVGHLETWADSLEALKKIADNRMPNVAELLAAAAKAPGKPGMPGEGQADSKGTEMAGNNRSDKPGKGGGESRPSDDKSSNPPSLVDVESGFNKDEEGEESSDDEDSQGGKGRLSLPTTVLNGGPKGEKGPPQSPQEGVNEAVQNQEDLLAEFQKVREDLQKIMDDLENSTFVKRLKAASRRQMEIADDLNRTLFDGFGISNKVLEDRQVNKADRIAEREDAQSKSVWLIQSDMEAYYDRRKQPKFLKIIEQMEDTKVTTSLTGVGDRVRQNLSGESISRAEFWSDTLDRWAEELVEPSPGGS